MKRSILILVLMIFTASLLAGCMSAKTYAAKMTPILKDYNDWSTGDMDMYHKILASATVLDETKTYGDLVMGTVYTYRIGQGVPPSSSWNPVDVSVYSGILTVVHNNALKVEKALKAITPPVAVSRSHQQMIDCLDYEIAVTGVQLQIFNDGTYKDLSYDTNPCKDIQAHIDLLTQYVNEHSVK